MSTSADFPSSGTNPPEGTERRWATWRTVFALILREMSTRYGRSPGGYLWAILEPLGAIIILSFGFSLLVRAPSLGNSFLVFYASGYLPFNIYQSLSLTVSRTLSFSKPLLMYPVVTWTDAIIARLLLNALTGVLVTYLLMAGIIALTDTRIVIEVGPLAKSMGLATLFGFGVGTLNCVLGGLYPVYEVIWSIATRPLFIISGIFFLYEDLPRNLQSILWYNPLIHITGRMRTGIFPTYQPIYVNDLYVLGVSLVCLLLGLILMSRYHRDILNN
jgi:capsular polysaccharide transport system permease protein